jgi:glycosyltransferase involved in cell wall biosynthesis
MIIIEESDKQRTCNRRLKVFYKRAESTSFCFKVCSLFTYSLVLVVFLRIRLENTKKKTSLFDSRSFTQTGPRVFIRSHELSITGAPRVCAELALLLSDYYNANVIFSVAGESHARMESASFRLASLIPHVNFSIDTTGSVEEALSADIVIVSTAAPYQLDWMHRFRSKLPTFPALIWWIHEGQSVMHEWPESHTHNIAATMVSGLVNLIIFPSFSTQAWWLNVLDSYSKDLFTSKVSNHVALPWGLPGWRQIAIQSTETKSKGELLRTSLGIKPSDFVFLVVGSYNRLKGHRGIAKAFKKAKLLCNGESLFHLVTVGVALGATSSFFPQSDIEWAKEDPTIHLLGESDSIPSYLAMANVYVSNTLDGGETWGLATLEALAAGVPVLSSDVGGASEMLKNGSYALLHSIPALMDDSEADELAENMCRLWKDDKLRTHLAAKGRAYVETQYSQRYLEDSIISTFMDLSLFQIDN